MSEFNISKFDPVQTTLKSNLQKMPKSGPFNVLESFFFLLMGITSGDFYFEINMFPKFVSRFCFGQILNITKIFLGF